MKNFLNFLRESETDGGRRGAILEGGTPLRSLAEAGFRTVRSRAQDPNWQRTYCEAQRLVDRVMKGDRRAMVTFQEAMTMSDFGTYFSNIMDRSILANYAETPYSWDAFAKRASIRDFRQAQIFRSDRGAAVLDGPILPNSYSASGTGTSGLTELAEYPMRKRVMSNYTDQLYKFGALMDYSWETMINDDLDALKDTPELFGRASRRTEEQRATKLFASSTGPNATFFSNANLNLVNATVNTVVTTNNPPLSVTSLAWALIIMASQLDLDGMPISIEGLTLVVPPALDITARNIVNAVQIFMNDQGGTVFDSGSGATATKSSAQRLLTSNWANGRVRPVVNYFLPIVNTTSGNTAWYLFANPAGGRPAMRLSFLAGHERPEMFMKASNAIPIGENSTGAGAGMSNTMDGDFDTDSILYKVRLVLGGTLLDPKMGVASTGAGS